MSLSNYMELEMLDHIFGCNTKNWTPFTSLWVGLGTALSGETDLSGEPSGSNYARVATSEGDWENAAAGSLENATSIVFPEASGSWGTIDYFGLFSSDAGGSLVAWGSLTASKAIGDGDTPKFAEGAMSILLD